MACHSRHYQKIICWVMISRDSVIAIEDGLLIVCYDHTPGGQIVSVTVSRVFGPKDTSFSSSLSLSLLKGIVVINQIFYLYERK